MTSVSVMYAVRLCGVCEKLWPTQLMPHAMRRFSRRSCTMGRMVPKTRPERAPLRMRAWHISMQSECIVIGWTLLRWATTEYRARVYWIRTYVLAHDDVDYRNIFHFIAERISRCLPLCSVSSLRVCARCVCECVCVCESGKGKNVCLDKDISSRKASSTQNR